MSASAACLDDRMTKFGSIPRERLHDHFKRLRLQQRSLLHGPPPKIVWLRTGNCTRTHLLHLIVSSEREIRAFGNPMASVLVLS
ncbi:DUF5615 family PIN-like protein [Luteolibacter sp. Populi]|uniref:DUF5615 family PIN-like protein n=1 Tax=Luteolibacter sp. Populi TaxID=3230487 RepID=UPI00346660C8